MFNSALAQVFSVMQETQQQTPTAHTRVLGFDIPYEPMWVIPAFLILLFAVALVCNQWLTRFMARRAVTAPSVVADILLKQLRRWLPFWLFLLGIIVVVDSLSILADIAPSVRIFVTFAFILSVIIPAATFVLALLDAWAQRRESVRTLVPALRWATKLLFATLGILIVLDKLNVSITPLLTTLGIGGFAVALALQDTLANFFAGVYLMADRPFRVGDLVKLESGEEGAVLAIGWRSTKVRTFTNNVVIVPNQKMAQSVLTNYNLPDPELAVSVPVSVGYTSDLQKVERVALEVAKEVQRETPGGVANFEPQIRFQAFGDSSIHFTALLRAQRFSDRPLLVHEFIKRLHARFAQEGIDTSSPQRVVQMQSKT